MQINAEAGQTAFPALMVVLRDNDLDMTADDLASILKPVAPAGSKTPLTADQQAGRNARLALAKHVSRVLFAGIPFPTMRPAQLQATARSAWPADFREGIDAVIATVHSEATGYHWYCAEATAAKRLQLQRDLGLSYSVLLSFISDGDQYTLATAIQGMEKRLLAPRNQIMRAKAEAATTDLSEVNAISRTLSDTLQADCVKYMLPVAVRDQLTRKFSANV